MGGKCSKAQSRGVDGTGAAGVLEYWPRKGCHPVTGEAGDHRVRVRGPNLPGPQTTHVQRPQEEA